MLMIGEREKAYAKINLFLHVTGKRQDGYHLLDSLVVFPDIGDELRLVPVKENQKDLVSLEIDGPFAHQLLNEDHANNLIVKTAYGLASHAEVELPKVSMLLSKNLPVSSGIGGGSSDAAAAFRLLMRYWGIRLGKVQMLDLALSIGADVPVCLDPVPQRMQGIGELVSREIRLPSFGMVLVNHGESVSTAQVFKEKQFDFSQPAALKKRFDTFMDLIQDMALCHNDLQPPAISLNPRISEVLEAIGNLPECRLARMSGSGATCFGLFETAEQARHAANLLSGNDSWWVWGGSAVR